MMSNEIKFIEVVTSAVTEFLKQYFASRELTATGDYVSTLFRITGTDRSPLAAGRIHRKVRTF